jgi:hypothetical protein
VGFDLDDKQQGTVREVSPSPFDGGEKRCYGGTRFDSKVFRDSAYSEATITYNINVGGIRGVDVVIRVD